MHISSNSRTIRKTAVIERRKELKELSKHEEAPLECLEPAGDPVDAVASPPESRIGTDPNHSHLNISAN